jgi:hypothetical protein
VITPAQFEQWGGWAGWFAVIGFAWNRLKLSDAFKSIKSIQIDLDGKLEYRSRAEIAEAKLQEKDAVQDRSDKRQIAAQERADRKEHDRL